jgi:mannose-1-phosphate guanylyltransferase
MSPDGPVAIVLAGTHRWSASTFERLGPRPLIPVALLPLISYPLRWLREAGIHRATICANGTTRLIEAALGDGSALGMELDYYQDGTPRGAAGCVRDAGARTGAQTLVITDASAIPGVNLAALLAFHRASAAAATAVVHHEHSPTAPPTPAGVYVFERRVLDHIAERGFQDIKENLIPKLHRAGERVVAHESAGFGPHVFDAHTYLAVSQWMLQHLDHAGDGLRHPTAWVEPGARLVGPVQLGPGVRVHAGATVIGPTSIGADSTVGRNALVARSVAWSRCVVGEWSVVHGCILGDDAVVPPLTRLFNVVRSQQQNPAPSRPSRERQPWATASLAASPGRSFRGPRPDPAPTS